MILGLLVGGVLSGRALIRAAELRAITTEYSRYVAAVQTFREKYFALPGDMPNAFRFWGATCGTDTTTIITGCNGNGDGFIYSGDIGEHVKAWEHLSRAGLISGSYDGTGTLNASNCVLLTEQNSLKSRFPKAIWGFYNVYCMQAIDAVPFGKEFDFATMSPGNYMQIGEVGGQVDINSFGSLSNDEAWSIDAKVDDGNSCTGFLRGQGDDDFNCSSPPSGPDSWRALWNGSANLITFIMR
ncbi:MAG: hypothetical protein ACOYNL_09300 [Rickettsiales bacterium]